ncbi:hypothetical protein HJC23_005982 [Cyclotella cryptica]|uniref:Helicase-associated domain-containing protein n=1 Tax=Cyclotella cryptica TaxID=29204 RepID=A0ABD3NXI9_9STRA
MTLPSHRWLANFYKFHRFRDGDIYKTPDPFSLDTEELENCLSCWVSEQSDLRYNLRLHSYKIVDSEIDAVSESIHVLETIPNFPWTRAICDNKFDARIEAIVNFRDKHGHCTIPQSTPDGLGAFVNRLRAVEYKRFVIGQQTKLRLDHVQLLESIGFEWSVKDSPDIAWDKKFKMLVSFKSQNGHSNVPRVTKGDKEMTSLGRWVAEQRKYHEENKLLPDRVLKLDSIGFRWSIKKYNTR